MFTGIVEELGTIAAVTRAEGLTIRATAAGDGRRPRRPERIPGGKPGD